MRYLTIVLSTTLLTVGLARAEEPVHLRYVEDSGPMTLTMLQSMEVREPVASREMSFDLTLTTDSSNATASLVIDRAKATFTAHGMEQRLSTRHLSGSRIDLEILDGGRRLSELDPDEAPIIDVGPPVDGGFSVASLLIDLLPQLPDGPVTEGSSWSTQREIRLLEGWAWSSGELECHHQVTSVEERDGRKIITVETEGSASLASKAA